MDFYLLHFRMDAIPSAHLRQQKLEHQRQLIEQKQKQKRQSVRNIFETPRTKFIFRITELFVVTISRRFETFLYFKHREN